MPHFVDQYKRIAGLLKSEKFGNIEYWFFPGLNNLLTRKEGEIGKTSKVSIPFPFDAGNKEVETLVKNMLEQGKI